MTGNEQIGLKTTNELGRTPVKSNLGLTGCYNLCGATHWFSKKKREACRGRCDQQFSQEQEYQDQQQEMLKDMLNDEGGGLSTGTIVAIIGSIAVLTIGGVLLIRYFKKKKSA